MAAQEDDVMEEDPDVKGGGQAAEDRRRTVKQVRCQPAFVSTLLGVNNAMSLMD